MKYNFFFAICFVNLFSNFESQKLTGILNSVYSLSYSQVADANYIGLSAHQISRQAHGVPGLMLNVTLATQAQKWSRTIAVWGQLLHSWGMGLGEWYGENLFFVCEPSKSILANVTYLTDRATMNWYNEIFQYNYSNPGYNEKTGHFTQIVWKDTTQVGFGVTVTNNTIGGSSYQCAFIVAQYISEGNTDSVQAFIQNVFPPKYYPDWSTVAN